MTHSTNWTAWGGLARRHQDSDIYPGIRGRSHPEADLNSGCPRVWWGRTGSVGRTWWEVSMGGWRERVQRRVWDSGKPVVLGKSENKPRGGQDRRHGSGRCPTSGLMERWLRACGREPLSWGTQLAQYCLGSLVGQSRPPLAWPLPLPSCEEAWLTRILRTDVGRLWKPVKNASKLNLLGN